MSMRIGQRRSERIFLDVPVVVRGVTPDNRIFQEDTFTLIVNAHGALLMLEKQVALGQKLLVMNPKNWDECQGEVNYIGPPYAGLAKVGIEFTRPVPGFWSVTAPPSDWSQT